MLVIGSAKRYVARPICTDQNRTKYARVKRCTLCSFAGPICNLDSGKKGACMKAVSFRKASWWTTIKNENSTFKQVCHPRWPCVRKKWLSEEAFFKIRYGLQRIEPTTEPRKVWSAPDDRMGFYRGWLNFAFLDFKNQMRLFEKPVSKMFRVAVLFCYCNNWLSHNEASQYFALEPPILRECLQ